MKGALSPLTTERLNTLFPPEHRPEASRLLAALTEDELLHCAALKCSDGNLEQLRQAISLAQTDFRDLLMAAGFGRTLDSHLRWRPDPYQVAPAVDPAQIEAEIAHLLSTLLPGFTRSEHIWARPHQSIHLRRGASTRIQTGFTVELRLASPNHTVICPLPRASSGCNSLSRGDYAFEKGDHTATLLARIETDFRRHALPWLARFTSPSEIAKGLKDGTFEPSFAGEPGEHWVL